MVGILLVLAYALPYLNPTKFPFVAVLTLSISPLILANLFFTGLWAVGRSKYFFYSGIILFMGLFQVGKLLQISTEEMADESSFSLMSYNVRIFDLFHWSQSEDIDQSMYAFIDEQHPDILCLQEFYDDPTIQIQYRNHVKKLKGNRHKVGQIIYSEFPILGSGSLDFENSNNNAIYADLLIDKDTLRVYNIHLQSLQFKPTKAFIESQDSKRLIERLDQNFKIQVDQANKVIAHASKVKHPVVFAGDFNNTAFSYIYRILSKGKKDAFFEKGNGFSPTFQFPFPLRIDFILADPSLETKNYKRFDQDYSDHYPILASFNLNP